MGSFLPIAEVERNTAITPVKSENKSNNAIVKYVKYILILIRNSHIRNSHTIITTFLQIRHTNTAKNKLLNYKYTIKTIFYYMHTWLTQLTVIVLFYHCKEIFDIHCHSSPLLRYQEVAQKQKNIFLLCPVVHLGCLASRV